MIERVIVAGGGTGGHLFPGIAVVEELRRRAPHLDVTFVGTERGIETRVLPAMGERLELLEVTPLKGRSPGELVKSLARLPGAATRAMALVRRIRPDLVIGVGGYASGPLLAAAATLRVPTAILEQNARVGLTNRLLAPVVGRAYVSFAETASTFAPSKVRVSGNPVRRAFVEMARRAAADPAGFEARARKVLVLGGSQGARAINERIPETLARAGLAELSVVHQTGASMRDEVEAKYRELGIDAEVIAFIDDMPTTYASAAVVIARAGATTVAELAAVGRPSILIPYPLAADDHQQKNAEALERAGAAVTIAEKDIDERSIGGALAAILGDPDRRRSMADAARGAGHPDAAAQIVDDLTAWLGGPLPTSSAGGVGTAAANGEDGDDGGGALRRSSVPGRLPYEPSLGGGAHAALGSTPSSRPALIVGWEA